MALTTLERTNITKLVVAMFNAAPGADYLAEFAGAYEANGGGLSALSTLAQGLANTSAYKALNPDSQTAEEFAAEFLTPLGLQANAEAFDFVVTKVKAGENKGQIVFEAAVAIDGYTGDNAGLIAAHAILNNKTAVAEYYSVAMEVHQTSLVALQQVISTVTSDAATVTAAEKAIDTGAGTTTFTLTPGVDTFIGTTGNDIINALSVDSTTGRPASTLNAFDSIEGGAGNDTLNIYTTSGSTPRNSVFPANATVKNVETINIFNAGSAAALGDASKYVGATAINQIGAATNVVNLADGTTAGFKNIVGAGSVIVTTAAAATTAAIALSNVAEGSTVNVVAGTTAGVLNSVTVSGTVTDTNADGTVDQTSVKVTAGKDVVSVAVNTAVATTLLVANTGTKAVATVDASASTGDINYTAATTVANIKTGTGADIVTLNTAFSATVNAASVSTGAGNDVITVITAGAGTVSIDAGAGNDKIDISSSTLVAGDHIDGGADVDTLKLTTGSALIAGDYVLAAATVSNIENLEFANVITAADGAKLSQFSTLTFDQNASGVINASQALVAHGDLTASAVGYVAAAGATPATYAGALNITADGGDITIIPTIITANGDTATITVNGLHTAAVSQVNIFGDLKTSLTVNTVNTTDSATAPTVDHLVQAYIQVDASNNAALKSVVLTGNGSVTLISSGADALATIDASGLGGTLAYGATTKGNITGGLTFTGNAALAESITLGAGHDVITVNSTYAKMDTISGFDAVKETATLDLTSTSDVLAFAGLTLDGATAAAGISKLTLSAVDTSLDLALVDAAAAAGANVVQFNFGGDTYLFKDAGVPAGLDAADLVVKLVGTVDLTTAFAIHA